MLLMLAACNKLQVLTGRQTHSFQPVSYVDIENYEKIKFDAYLCHVSQKLSTEFHTRQHRKRGAEADRICCEAFIPFSDSEKSKILFD